MPPSSPPPFPLQNFCIQPCEITVIFQISDGELELNSSPSASMPCAPINVQTTLPLQYCPSQKIGQGSYERGLGMSDVGSTMHDNPNFSRGVPVRSTYSYNPRQTGGGATHHPFVSPGGGVGSGSNSQPSPNQGSGFFKRLIPTRFSSRR